MSSGQPGRVEDSVAQRVRSRRSFWEEVSWGWRYGEQKEEGFLAAPALRDYMAFSCLSFLSSFSCLKGLVSPDTPGDSQKSLRSPYNMRCKDVFRSPGDGGRSAFPIGLSVSSVK